jgi:hypothetical protein
VTIAQLCQGHPKASSIKGCYETDMGEAGSAEFSLGQQGIFYIFMLYKAKI